MRPASSIFLLAAAVASLCGQPAASVWDGVYSEEQAGRGSRSMARNVRHAMARRSAAEKTAPPLTGSAFMANWSGLTVGELFERIRLSMPEGRPGTLSRQQNADILAYMLSVNQFPAGKTELQKDTDRLKQIRFLAEKPEPGK